MVGLAVLVLGFLWLFEEALRLIVPPLALSGLLVYLLNPIVRVMGRWRIPRPLGTGLTYLVVTALIVASTWLIGPVLARQGAEFAQNLPQILVSLQDTVNDNLARLGIEAEVSLDPESSATGQVVTDFIEQNRDELLDLARSAGAVLVAIATGLVTAILSLVIAFYLLADLPRLADGIRRLIPPGKRSEVVDVAERILTTVGAYFRGQLLVALFVGVFTSLGLAAIGLPFWAIIGLTAGVFNLVPFIGPFVGGLLGVVVALTTGGGLGQAVAVVVVMTLVQQVDNHVVTPSILSRTVHVHPVTIILALAIAATQFGILGMLVAIPFVAASKLLILYVLVTRFPSMAHLAGQGPDIIDGVPVGDPREGGLVALGRDLWRARERRRKRQETPRADRRPRV
jgi:predicted PurR-regulated permease PerM